MLTRGLSYSVSKQAYCNIHIVSILIDWYEESFGISQWRDTDNMIAAHTWTLGQVTGLLLVRASRAGGFYTLSMTGLHGRPESIGAGLGAGTPQGPGREAGILI